MRVCLVSCSKSKSKQAMLAKDLYNSPRFKASRKFAEYNCDEWFILSALHGLVHPDEFLAPYDTEMKDLNSNEKHNWNKRVLKRLQKLFKPGTIITLLAGEDYCKSLCKYLIEYGYEISKPLEGKGIGKGIGWLKHINESKACLKHLDYFYELLQSVPNSGVGIKNLEEFLKDKQTIKCGVYFFFDSTEPRLTLPNHPRIIRVGTHAVSRGSKSTFSGRLRQHRGTLSGLGNHRGSIFRLHVGKAMLAKYSDKLNIESWGKGQNAPRKTLEEEELLERMVSEYLKQLLVLGVEINDAPGPSSDRSYIEKNAVGLLATVARIFDPPSESWLGLFSYHKVIRESGLWNVDHVDFSYDPFFLKVLKAYVDIMKSGVSAPSNSIAPPDWYMKDKEKKYQYQYNLFDEGDNI